MIAVAGFYPDMAADQYFADPCRQPSLNQSLIPDLLKRSPMHAAHKHPRLNPYGGMASDGDKAMWLGSAVHRLALGRGREISTIRYRDYTSGAARDARDLALANGRIPILEHELVKARDMADILKRRISEALDGAPYVTEVVICWQEHTRFGPIWCRAMLDVWCEAKAMALDPKALSTPATADAFGRTASNSGYDIQAVFYSRGLSVLAPKVKGKVRFANLVVENTPPHGDQMLEPDEDSRRAAESLVVQAMETFARCLYARDWPGYPKGIQPYATPSWAQRSALA